MAQLEYPKTHDNGSNVKRKSCGTLKEERISGIRKNKRIAEKTKL